MTKEGFEQVVGNFEFKTYLNPIPPDDFLKNWEDDYKTMQTNMIPEDSPNFSKLLETVKQATQEYNHLNFNS